MIRKLFVSLIVIIFVNFMAVAVMLWSFEKNYLSADFYNGPAGEKISEIAATRLSKKIVEENTQSDLNLTEADYYQMIKSLFSKEFIHLTAQSTLDQLANYHEKKSLKISLSSLKENTQPATLEIAETIVAGMEECKKEDLQTPQPTQLKCIPPGMEKEELVVQVQQEIETNLIAYIPDEIVIDKNGQLQDQLNAISTFLSEKEQYEKAAIIFLVVVLLLIALIIFKPWHSIVTWYGSTFVLTALVLLLNGLLLDNLEIFVSNIISQKLSAETLSHINFFLQFFIKDLLFTGSIALGLGVVLYIGGKLLKPYRVDQPNPKP